VIGYIKGTILSRKPDCVVLTTGGIGYEISVSFRTFQELKEEGKEEELLIHTVHKDDTLMLFGFKTKEERDLFRVLIVLSGFGPKTALAILSRIDTETFKKAVATQDITLLTSIGGIGKKRAEKLLFGLKEMFKDLYGPEQAGKGFLTGPLQQGAVKALEGLGYSKTEAADIIRKIPADKEMTLEDLIKKALSA